MAGVQKTFALIAGLVLLLVAVMGFINSSLVGDTGFFGTNTLQDVLHLVAGICGVYAGTKGMGYGYNKILGWIGVLLGVLGFIPGIDSLFASLLNINTNITVLHLVLGVIFLGVYYGARK